MKKHRNFLVGTIATICLTTVMPFSVLAGNIGLQAARKVYFLYWVGRHVISE